MKGPLSLSLYRLLLVAAAFLAACDPRFVGDEPGRAELSLVIEDSGRAHLDVEVGHEPDTGKISSITDHVASAAFPHVASVKVDVNENPPGGWPFGVVHVDGLYRPGPEPKASLEMAPVVRVLDEAGFRSIGLSLCSFAIEVEVTAAPPGMKRYSCWTGRLVAHHQPLRSS